MPPKKKVGELKTDDLLLGGDGDSEMIISSPGSVASLDPASSSLSLTADLLKSLMADNHAAMTALIASIPSPVALPAAIPSKTPKIEVPKWKDGEAPHDYFLKYEKAQSHNEVPKEKWGVLLHVFFSGTAQAAYGQVNPDHLDDYDRVKSTMLRSLRDTPEQADRNWWRLARKSGESMGSFYLRMRAVAVRRFDGFMSREAIFEKVLLSRLLYLLPSDQYNSVTLKDPKTAEDAADIVDELESRGDFSLHHPAGGGRYGHPNHHSRRDNGQHGSYGHSRGGSHSGGGHNGSAPSGVASSQDSSGNGKGNRRSPTPPASGNSSGSGKNFSDKKRVVICYSCKEPGHIKPNCPNRIRRLSPCDDVDCENDVAEPMWVDGWIGDKEIKGMRFDSGSDRTVVDSKFVPVEAYLGNKVVLKGWRGKQSSIHELARITLRVGDKLHKKKKVAVEADMEYPALLGADLNRAMKREIMKGVMEEWAEESVVDENENESRVENFPAEEAMSSEAVRITRAQARREKENEEANAIASEQADCTPTPLEQIFDFDDDLFLDNTAATSVAELCTWPEVTAVDTQIPIVSDKSTLAEEQTADVTLKPLHELAVKLEKGYKYDDGILVQGEEDCLGDLTCRVVVPKGRRQALLDMAHSGLVSGHFGVKKTYAKLSSHFIWPRMWVEVKAYVRSCGGCQRASRNTNARAPLQPLPCVGEPFHLVAFDLVGPIPKSVSGYRYILTMMDMFSKYLEAIPLKRVDNEAVLEGMLEIFSRHGIPGTILTDQGSVFMSRLTKAVCQSLGIEQIRTSPYHPQSDGALERWHACLKGMLKRSEADLKYWDRHLRYLLFAYRDTPHCVTGFSPFSLLFGREVKGPLGLVHSSWLDGDCEAAGTG